MATDMSQFDPKINKVSEQDLTDGFRQRLDDDLLSELDHKKLEAIAESGGALGIVHPLILNVNGTKHTFNAVEDMTVEINPTTVGASPSNHNHDTIYSKLDHNHDSIYSKLGHTHAQYSLTSHNHDDAYSKLDHVHNYAGSNSPGGVADKAAILETAREIKITGAVTGAVNFDGGMNVEIDTSVNHEHTQYALSEHNHDDVYSKLGHTHPYIKVAGDTMTGDLHIANGRFLTLDYFDPDDEEYIDYFPTKVIFSGKAGNKDNNGYIGALTGGSSPAHPIDEIEKIIIGFGSGVRTSGGLVIGRDDLMYCDKPVWNGWNQGHESGMDADTLDTHHASYFATATHLHDDRYVMQDGTKTIKELLIAPNATTTPLGVRGTNGNDWWRIGGYLRDSTDIDDGALEIATGDNGTEPIYVRQYTGSIVGGTAVEKRTLILLSESGNSYFPGAIYETGKSLGSKYLRLDGLNEMTANLDMGVGHYIVFKPVTSGENAIGLAFRNNNGDKFGAVGYKSNNGAGEYIYIGIGEDAVSKANSLIIDTNGITYKNNKVWHAGNDGSGSGLDADLLDGKHYTEFVQSGSVRIADNADLNTLTTDGFRGYAIGGNSCANKPVANNNAFYLEIDRCADGWYAQKLTESSGKTYQRFYGKTDNVWEGWENFYTSKYPQSIVDKAIALNTARLIGNASFNGTANITLDQIGAMALGSIQLTNQDLNTLKTDGKRYYAAGGNTCANVPPGVESFGLEIKRASGGEIQQVLYEATAANKNRIWTRQFHTSNSAWTNWSYLYSQAYPPNGISKLGSTITLGDGAEGSILQNEGNYHQKIRIIDNATTNDAVFEFQQSSDKGATFKTLMTIKDNGDVQATRFLGSLVGNSDTATKFKTARKIGNASFDGTADISLASIGAAAASHTHNYAASTSAGGPATTATKLATARKIGNANFDGSANITLAQIGAAPAPLIFKNITISNTAWNTSSKSYEYANASILASHIPEIYFSEATMDIAGAADIIVSAIAGKLVFKYDTIPTGPIIVEVAYLKAT